MSLIVKQITEDGRRKVWKLNSEQGLYTFGTSRKADLGSIDHNVESFEGVFEYRSGQWHYITFSTQTSKSCLELNTKTQIKINHSTLQFEFSERQSFVLDQLTNIATTNTNSAEQLKLILVTRGHQVIQTEVLKPNDKFEMFVDGIKKELTFNSTQEWKTENFGIVNIQHRLANAYDTQKLKERKKLELSEVKNQQAQFYSIGGAFLLIILSLIFAQSNKPAQVPPVQVVSATNIVMKPNLQKKLKQQAPAPRNPAAVQTQDNGGGPSTKTASLLKAAVGTRISQLLGKVSATEARTANVLVAPKGIKAGEEASGRALSAIGKVESSGRNWNGESVGKGTGVSTAGVGGGKGISGLGSGLGQGKTGSGGVGLIEEESEIVGGLDREVIAQYIKTQLGQILYCYERQLSASPDLYGKVAVKFTISGTGQVETQAINDTTLKNRSVENCVLSKIAKWKFPEPKGGTKVVVTYPFLFKSTN